MKVLIKIKLNNNNNDNNNITKKILLIFNINHYNLIKLIIYSKESGIVPLNLLEDKFL